MPPKRKRTDEASAADPSSARATRSSSRGSSSNTAAAAVSSRLEASTRSSTGKAGEEEAAESIPPAKKSRTKNTTKPPSARATKSKGKQVGRGSILPAAEGVYESSVANPNDNEPESTKALPPQIPSAPTPPPKPVVSEAIPSYLPPPSNEIYTPQRSLALFAKYTENDNKELIGPEGFERLCSDAQFPLDGSLPLILAWQLGAKEMAKITKEEWVSGTAVLKSSSLYQLAMAVTDLENLLILNKPAPKASGKKEPYDKTTYWTYCENEKTAFQKLYMFCFMLAKPEQSKNFDMETAAALWSVLLVPRYPIMSDVLGFIDEKRTYKAVNKDLWNMMLEFCQTVNPNLSDYEGDGAWPTLLDDFVLWKKGPATEEHRTTE